jgi:predicted RNase H-like HicB family nuclease
MTSIHVRYHPEDDGWGAESDDLPGWTAVGHDFSAVRALACSGVREFAGPEAVLVEEGALITPAPPDDSRSEKSPRQSE